MSALTGWGYNPKVILVGCVGAALLAWVIWCTPRKSESANLLVRCLLLNFAVLLFNAALLRLWDGGFDARSPIGTYYRYDDFGALVGAVLLIITNLGIAVYLIWRFWPVPVQH